MNKGLALWLLAHGSPLTSEVSFHNYETGEDEVSYDSIVLKKDVLAEIHDNLSWILSQISVVNSCILSKSGHNILHFVTFVRPNGEAIHWGDVVPDNVNYSMTEEGAIKTIEENKLYILATVTMGQTKVEKHVF